MRRLVAGGFLVACLLGVENGVVGQDIRFSQPWRVPLRYNPALMSLNAGIDAVLHARFQWLGIAGGYKTYHLHGMAPVLFTDNGKLDVGLSVLMDEAGAYQMWDARLAVGYTMLLSRHGGLGVSVALMGGYGQRSLDVSGLKFDDQVTATGAFDPNIPTANVVTVDKLGLPVVGAGIDFFRRSEGSAGGRMGFYIDYLNRPDVGVMEGSDTGMPFRYTMHIELILPEEDYELVGGLYAWRHGGSEELAIGGLFRWFGSEDWSAEVGLWYRFDNSISFTVGGRYRFIRLMYSYDLPSGMFSQTFGGQVAHEVSLGVFFPREHTQWHTPKY